LQEAVSLKSPEWHKVRAIMVEKENPHVLFVKYDHVQVNFIPFVTAVSHRSNQTSPAVLPNESTVSKAKKDDLLFMCNQLIIPKDYHFFYSLLSIDKKMPEKAQQLQKK